MISERAREALEVRAGTMMRTLAGANDLSTRLLWGAEREEGVPATPAWFSPVERTVTINATFALQGADPALVNPLTVSGRKRYPHIVGLGCHEAGHVRFTQWGRDGWARLGQQSASVREMALLLEEPRVERCHLGVRPQDREYLRAQSVLIDLAQFSAPSGRAGVGDGWRAGVVALLTLGRGDAGILAPEDLATPREALSRALGATLPRLEAIWRQALRLEDGDLSGLIDLARRWVREVGEKPVALGPFASCPGPAPAAPVFADDGLAEDAGGLSSVESPDVISDVVELLVENIWREIKVGAEEQEQIDQHAKEEAQEQARAKKDARVQKKAQEKADEAFKSGRERIDPGERRPPTAEERALAVRMAKEVREARFRDRTHVKTLSETPPGRLQGREAVQRTAQRSLGMTPTARPFLSRRSRHTEYPPLSLGIMTDISGSMSSFWNFATAFSWASAQAVRDVGQSAAVAYGDKVSILNAPGECPDRPYPLGIGGNPEDWKHAFTIVDGALNLTQGKGARLLFVMSDGEYIPRQARAAREDVERLERNGARVVWFAPDRGRREQLMDILGPRGQRRLVTLSDAVAMSWGKSDHSQLVEAAISEITKALRQGLRD